MQKVKEIFKELLEKVESSNLPEGELILGMAITINSKSWFRMKFNLILSDYTEEEIVEEGLIQEWTDLVNNLIKKSNSTECVYGINQSPINESNSVILNEPEERYQTNSEIKKELEEYLTRRHKSKVDTKYIDLCIDVYFAILHLYEIGTISSKISIRDCDMTLHFMGLTKKSFEESFEKCAMVRHYHDFLDTNEKDIVIETVKSFVI